MLKSSDSVKINNFDLIRLLAANQVVLGPSYRAIGIAMANIVAVIAEFVTLSLVL